MKVISHFDNGSVARHAGLKEGDEIISFNGREFSDILDYLYADTLSEVYFDVKRKGRVKHVGVIKNAEEPLGINFKDKLEVKPIRCKNKCLFCFIDQLPKGMRDTMYVKDDDYRLSVISGNYVTMTNVTEKDLERIIEYKLSPLYISVHAWDKDVRKKLVTNPNTANLNDIIKRLCDNGITIHTQVVLCEGLNDGNILKETMEELYKLYPRVASLAIVPVGLTGCREGLYPLKPLSDKCLNDTIDIVEKFNVGKNWCWCSDEFYVKSGRKIPEYEYYGAFQQIENGVGLVAEHLRNFEESLVEVEKIESPYKKIAFITGESFYKILVGCIEKLRPLTNTQLDVFVVKNNFFSGAITVSGLVVGRDILEQVPKGYDKYVVPKNMLREFQNVFLDGTTTDELLRKLEGSVLDIASKNGQDTIDIIKR